MWCLPDFLLTPEMCGSPISMILFKAEFWLMLTALHFIIPFALLSGLVDAIRGGGRDKDY